MRDPKTPSSLHQEVRRTARQALYGGLAAVVVVLGAGLLVNRWLQPPAQDFSYLDEDYLQHEEVRLLRDYLRINTAQPNANELAGAQFLAAVLEREGIPYRLQRMGLGHANLWAELPGESPELVILHNHIDTDPVDNLEAWKFPPFEGAIERPYLYGRGAYDMKSTAIAQLKTLLELKRSGKRLKRSVLFLATGTEEVGSDLGTKWLLAFEPELRERAWAFLTEGGVVETRDALDAKYWGIEFAMKRFVDVTLCASSREPLEAVRQELIDERLQENFQVTVTPEVRAFMADYAPTRDGANFRRLLAQPEALLRDVPAWEQLPLYLKAFFRDEAIPFPIQETAAGDYRLLVKFHLLPGSDFERVRERLLPAWRIHGLTTSVYDEGSADGGSPLDHPAYRALVAGMREAYPQDPVGSLVLPWGATDARYARAAGIPAYGFLPFLIFTGDTFQIGYPNERISLPVFVKGVEIYRRVVERLAS
jgi:acetylornithine deacetylase/succinyl-diaminopimelate desuccinylase-like protein